MFPLAASRFWLWIDEVGGFVVSTRETVSIGQAQALRSDDADAVDLPILADISRRHAAIRRQGEGYLLETSRAVRIDGEIVERAAPLRRDCLIELGRDVKLQFRQPHPWSLSARVELASRHRTQPTVDGVLLVRDTLILGPSASSHVVCPGWTEHLVLIWQGESWRTQPVNEPWLVNDRPLERDRPLELPARLVGPAGTISLTEHSNLGVSRTK